MPTYIGPNNAVATAVQQTAESVVVVNGQPVVANNTDWVVSDTAGNVKVIPNNQFAQQYTPLIQHGFISVTTGGSPSSGALVAVSFGLAFGAVPTGVLLQQVAGPALPVEPTSINTGGFTVSAIPAPAASTFYSFYWEALQ